MDWFHILLYFDDEELIMEHSLICDGFEEATKFLDDLFLRLHMPGALPDFELDAWRRPSGMGLKHSDSEEILVYMPLVSEAIQDR